MNYQTRQTEIIVSQGKPIMEGVKNCKSFKKALETLISQQTRRGNIELQFYTTGILELYKKFHPEKLIEVPVDSWKGKSSFQILKDLDGITIIKYQKPSKGEEPKKVEYRANKEELQAILTAIQTLGNQEGIKTKHLAMIFSRELGLNHQSWKEFFADRYYHNLITLILGALDSLGYIKYSGGKTTILNNKLSVQLLLED